MINEGYIKFKCLLIEGNPPTLEDLSELNECRNTLYRMGLIGMYADGIGFGNISIKKPDGRIIITGSKTGACEKLNPEDYCTIENYSFESNNVICSGAIKASSETLTHAALYECSKTIKCVIHIHSHLLWNRLINKIPTTSPEVEYGTPEMAYEIKRIFTETNAEDIKVMVMGGHKEGIICFGENVSDCYANLIENIK